MTKRQREPFPWVVVALSALMVMLLGYVGSYYAAVERGSPAYNQYIVSYGPRYRVQSHYSLFVYYPIHQLDRALRPNYWQHEDTLHVFLHNAQQRASMPHGPADSDDEANKD